MIKADNLLSPVSGEPPRSLVVMLHGVGSNGADLMPLAEHWAPQMPETLFISPNAPFPFIGLTWGDAFQWFSLDGITPENREQRVKPAAELLNRFLDEQLSALNLPDAALCLVGFSQGTILSLYTMLRRPQPCGGLLGYSGRLTGVESLETELKSKPRVFLIHGQEDAMIPISEFHDAVVALDHYGIPGIAEEVPHVGHTIAMESMIRGGHFLAYCLEHPAGDVKDFTG